MQQYADIITFSLILINIIISYRGLKNYAFFERYLFRVDDVLLRKEYIRLLSSGFLHINWLHLILNMVVLYIFGDILLYAIGPIPFLITYFAGLIGGNLMALYIHRNHGDYSAVGASGATCGMLFAYIALFPGADIRFLFLPISLPGWVYGLAYILYTIYGVRSKADNVGHEAHLGGAMVGMFTALAFHPTAFSQNLLTILVISIPAIVFIYIIVTRPHALMVENLYFTKENTTVEDRYNIAKNTKQKEIDNILEKIHRRGINSLTKAEKAQLDEYSKSG